MCFIKFNMQISAAITEKCISIYSSVNITDDGTKRVSTPMFLGPMKTVKTFLERSGVLQKKSMQISADITETLISLHLPLNRSIVEN